MSLSSVNQKRERDTLGSQESVGQKRGRDTLGSRDEALEFIPGLTLSQHPPQIRKKLFMKKFKNVFIAKSLHPTEFEGFTIRERFERMGWEALLNFSCEKIYKRAVIQWVSSLSRNRDELTGIVDGKSYIITPVNIRELLGVDTRKDLPYARFNEADFQTTTDENKRRWLEACKTVFGGPENVRKTTLGYADSKMTPLVRALWGIGVWTFFPRRVLKADRDIYPREIYLLHALATGDYLYSFAQLMIDDIWDMYEHEHQRTIPHGYYISEMLNQLGAVSKDKYVQIIPPQNRLLTTISFRRLDFQEYPTEYVIDDISWMMEPVIFPKKVIEQEANPCRVTPRPSLQMQATNLQTPSQSQTQHGEMMTMLINIQKQIDGPTQGNEIPKAFRDIFQDIYGKKP